MSPAAQQDGADSDEKRIRKTTPKEETLYVEGLYERVTQMASAQTEHRLLDAQGPGQPDANHRRPPTKRRAMTSHSDDRPIRGSGGTTPCCYRGLGKRLIEV
jgi:hypothetical protein